MGLPPMHMLHYGYYPTQMIKLLTRNGIQITEKLCEKVDPENKVRCAYEFAKVYHLLAQKSKQLQFQGEKLSDEDQLKKDPKTLPEKKERQEIPMANKNIRQNDNNDNNNIK